MVAVLARVPKRTTDRERAMRASKKQAERAQARADETGRVTYLQEDETGADGWVMVSDGRGPLNRGDVWWTFYPSAESIGVLNDAAELAAERRADRAADR